MGILDAFKGVLGNSNISDEQYYEAVARELSQGGMRPGLWTKALASCEYDEQRAKARYIQLRVESLKAEAETIRRDQQAAARLLASRQKALEADAMGAYRRGDHVSALAGFTSLAEKGDAWAQYNLGVIYMKGRGVPIDINVALHWLTKAANQNDKEAQYALGCLNMEHFRRYDIAVTWFSHADKNGHSNAKIAKQNAQSYVDATRRLR